MNEACFKWGSLNKTAEIAENGSKSVGDHKIIVAIAFSRA